ncbi:MAG: class I SAM-dependent methyltransferase [Gemmatimonadaceae bacterium]|nr:class I SAM-dependent methyltransferase [Gemmatimonadaceae bacterium]
MSDAPATPARQRRVPPILIVLVCQGIGMVLSTATFTAVGPVSPRVATILPGIVAGVYAALVGRVAGLDPWWMVIQLLFAPAVLLASAVRVPAWVWLAAFLLMAAVYWSTFRTQVPLYLSSSRVRAALVPLLPTGTFTFMDVGSGVGGVLLDLGAARPDGQYHGIESAPVPWLVSWLRIAAGRHRNCHAHWGSFWDCDLSRYDVVFAYLSPVPMAALWAKVEAEMRPGSTFISNTFAVDARPADRTVQVDDLHRSTLHVWTKR